MRLFQRFGTDQTPKSTARDFLSLEVRRRRAMRLLTQGVSQAEVARRLGVSEVSVCRWNKARVAKGGQAWKRGRLGKPPKISEIHLVAIREFVDSGASTYGFPDDRWTYVRIALVLKDRTGLRIHPDHLCRIFHRVGWVTQGTLKWGPSERRRSSCLEVQQVHAQGTQPEEDGEVPGVDVVPAAI